MVWSDLSSSRYFNIQEQSNIEPIIRSFNIVANATYLGQSFQGFASIRRLSLEEHQILAHFASKNILELRAQILPEDEIESTIAMGNSNLVEELLTTYNTGVSIKRREYLIRSSPDRNRTLAKKLSQVYSGTCQICGWQPKQLYSIDACEVHHIQWIARGGADDLKNLILICPNHHRVIHKTDAAFDYQTLSFGFTNHSEQLLLNYHL